MAPTNSVPRGTLIKTNPHLFLDVDSHLTKADWKRYFMALEGEYDSIEVRSPRAHEWITTGTVYRAVSTPKRVCYECEKEIPDASNFVSITGGQYLCYDCNYAQCNTPKKCTRCGGDVMVKDGLCIKCDPGFQPNE